MQILQVQSVVCDRFGVKPNLPSENERLGIAIGTLDLMPINGMRIPSLSGSAGWFIYGGEEPSVDDSFYSPVCFRRHSKANHLK